MISIVMPVKNGAAMLSECLPQVLRQRTTDRIEIIAIDSGSTDNSIEVLKKFGATVLAIEVEDSQIARAAACRLAAARSPS